MAQDNAEKKLLDFLDRKAFDPVLRARPDKYSDDERAKLEQVKEATRKERERYHHYGSARKIVEMFKDDLSSAPAKKVHGELRRLRLPTFGELRDEFDDLAAKLGAA